MISNRFYGLMRSCSCAASSGCVHSGHHDGRTGGDGFWGPVTEPAATEQIQLQPAGCGQRAGSDDRQWLVLYTLLIKERWWSLGRGKMEWKGDERQEEWRKKKRKDQKREINFCSFNFLLSSLCPSLFWLVQLNGDKSALWDTVLDHQIPSVHSITSSIGLDVAGQLPA